ncbi:MAG TPA: serine hydrolase [Puia sp.]|nr:serine hydrolase [Puia sp.]
MKIRVLLAAALLSSITVAAQTPAFVADSLDSYIQQGMKEWQIPGLALVIVKDGKVVVMKGYGVKDIQTKDPVDENTLFMIASNTKLFTATALAQLEYDKKLSLDDKITKYYPAFKLYEPTSTELVSIRDMLCHRIGTKTFQGDFTFWNSLLTRDEIMQKMRLLKPIHPFRQDFGYCNSCVMTAGQIIPKVTGEEWDRYVEDSLLLPNQMNHTYTSIHKVPGGVQLAQPYTTSFSGALHTVPLDQWDNLGPAAALISNVSDLSHWLEMQLDSGRYDGRQVLPFRVLLRTRDINTILSSRKRAGVPTHVSGYALGVESYDYAGREVYWHTGGAGGMVSVVCFIPEEKLGMAILTNNDNQDFFVLLRQQIIDAYLGLPYVNRSELSYRAFSKLMSDTLKTIDGWKARVRGGTPPLPLAAYAGHYTHPLYGSLDIRVVGGYLEVRFNGHAHLTARLEYMDNDEWLLSYDNILYGIFSTTFKVSGGKVVGLETKQSDFVEIDPYEFVKQ